MSIPTARIGIDIGHCDAHRTRHCHRCDRYDDHQHPRRPVTTPRRNCARRSIPCLKNATRPIDGIGIARAAPSTLKDDPERDHAARAHRDRPPRRARQSVSGAVIVDNDAVTARWRSTASERRGSCGDASAHAGNWCRRRCRPHGAILRGGDGRHAEAGHITVPNGPAPCYCGRATCFEQTGSRSGLQRRALAATGVKDLHVLRSLAITDATTRRCARTTATESVTASSSSRPSTGPIESSSVAAPPHCCPPSRVRCCGRSPR